MGSNGLRRAVLGSTRLERLSNGFDGILSGLRWVRQGYNESNPLETGFSGLRWVLHRISMGFVVFFPFYLNFDLCENDDRCRGFRGLFLLFSLSRFFLLFVAGRLLRTLYVFLPLSGRVAILDRWNLFFTEFSFFFFVRVVLFFRLLWRAPSIKPNHVTFWVELFAFTFLSAAVVVVDVFEVFFCIIIIFFVVFFELVGRHRSRTALGSNY